MTQLVGAICDGGKRVVTVSDRMVSTGDMTLQFEQRGMKAEVLTPTSVVLTAGTTHEPQLLDLVRSKIRGVSTIVEIADALKTVYQDMRDKHIVDEVLRPAIGIKSFDEWQRKQGHLHDAIVIDIDQAIKRYQLGVSLLLAGVDKEGHLFYIADPGIYRSFDTISYCTLGMGDRHAESVFAWFKYSKDFVLNEALYIAFAAKKRAEMAGGVGHNTDVVIISAKGIESVEPATIKILEGIYDEREEKWVKEKWGRSEFDERIQNLDIQTRKMEK